MAFRIIQGTRPIEREFVPIDRTAGATSLYVGQLVKADTGSFNGVAPLAAASGASDTSQKQIIYGVVSGFDYDPVSGRGLVDATHGQYMTSVQAIADQKAIVKMGLEGMHPKGDPLPMAQIDLIFPDTLLQGHIFNATYGVAPTLLTVTTVNATMGLGFTTNANDVATVANMCTAYCRKGANAGLYRVVKSASATVHTFDHYWPYTIAVGDQFVIVGARQGQSFVQINSTSGYLGVCFNNAATAASNYFTIDVKHLDLRIAGKETVVFKFNACHFSNR